MELITYRKTLDVHKNGIQFTLQGFETNDNMSRRIEINLMASGDTYELPLERVLALMYITTPKANEPSIEECIIKDNTIVYDVLPIVEEGITEMQLKLIDTSVDGAKSVLVSPRFAVEVMLSNTDDGSAEQGTSFTALENAVAKANAVYNERLTKIEVDDKCIFKAHYADGTIYETDTIQKMLLQLTTDMDLTSLVKDGLTNFTADELVDELDERYNYAFAKAIYSDDLAKTYDVPTFVKWDENTANTPFNSDPQLTDISNGFAICYGDALNHIIVAWVAGDKENDCFTYKVSDGTVIGWDGYINKSGGTMTGNLTMAGKLILSANPTSDMEATTKQYADGASLESYYAFCANVNSDSIDCAFGKNNEGRIRNLGLQLAMYAWFKGDSKTEYPFTELIKCNTILDFNNEAAFEEIRANENLFNLFTRGDYLDLSYPSELIFEDIVTIDRISWNNIDATETITVTQEMLSNEYPIYITYKNRCNASSQLCYSTVLLNGVEIDSVVGGYQRHTCFDVMDFNKYNIITPGDYTLTIKAVSNTNAEDTCGVNLRLRAFKN